MPVETWSAGAFFNFSKAHLEPSAAAQPGYWRANADRVLAGSLPFYSFEWREVGFPPDWHCDPMTRQRIAESRHWSDISEFALPGGDIKGYWEASRFDGLLILAIGYLESGDPRFCGGMERWLVDWCQRNPLNSGVNWKCAQEAGLRLLQTLLAAHLISRRASAAGSDGLRAFVEWHCRRIEPTMLYAVAQDNNHATSEAAALFAAGCWLQHYFPASPHAARWLERGRFWMENRVQRLIAEDGSFSQHSTNYHRLMLDTLWLAEFWRRQYGAAPFTEAFYRRARCATEWLKALTDPVSGDAPNLGANDGARAFVMHGLPFRDFRPTVQLASALFMSERPYDDYRVDEPLRWLGLENPATQARDIPAFRGIVFPQGGYARLSADNAWCMLRLPVYRFRPSHADALHLDLFVDGRNLLRDAGTFSYNTDAESMRYFAGTESHNTIQFDARDQMPKFGRFLFGSWLSCRDFALDRRENSAVAAYRGPQGEWHCRKVQLMTDRLIVTDEVSGFAETAVLRWRLAPGEWTLAADGRRIDGSLLRIDIDADMPIVRSEIVAGWEARHYGERSSVPVWEIEFCRPGRAVTNMEFLRDRT